jgi:hypothetical protein
MSIEELATSVELDNSAERVFEDLRAFLTL